MVVERLYVVVQRLHYLQILELNWDLPPVWQLDWLFEAALNKSVGKFALFFADQLVVVVGCEIGGAPVAFVHKFAASARLM